MEPTHRHSFTIENILAKGVNFSDFSVSDMAGASHFPFSLLPPHNSLSHFNAMSKVCLLPPAAIRIEFCSQFGEHSMKSGERKATQLHSHSQTMSPQTPIKKVPHFLDGNTHSNDNERRGMPSLRRAGHPYQRRAPAAQKKLRTSFSKAQLAVLERRFADQKYLASSERAPLAMELYMQDAQVKTWFQNRRTKWRRQEAEEREFEHKMKKALSENVRD